MECTRRHGQCGAAELSGPMAARMEETAWGRRAEGDGDGDIEAEPELLDPTPRDSPRPGGLWPEPELMPTPRGSPQQPAGLGSLPWAEGSGRNSGAYTTAVELPDDVPGAGAEGDSRRGGGAGRAVAAAAARVVGPAVVMLVGVALALSGGELLDWSGGGGEGGGGACFAYWLRGTTVHPSSGDRLHLIKACVQGRPSGRRCRRAATGGAGAGWSGTVVLCVAGTTRPVPTAPACLAGWLCSTAAGCA